MGVYNQALFYSGIKMENSRDNWNTLASLKQINNTMF